VFTRKSHIRNTNPASMITRVVKRYGVVLRHDAVLSSVGERERVPGVAGLSVPKGVVPQRSRYALDTTHVDIHKVLMKESDS